MGLSGCTVGWVGAKVQGKPEAGSPCAQPPSWVPEGCGSFGHLYLFDHTHQGSAHLIWPRGVVLTPGCKGFWDREHRHLQHGGGTWAP